LMASEHGVRRLTATVRGYVQGVGYRYYVLQHARALGLTGFARNERDDSVTVVAEGQASLLVQLTDALRRGPEGADVQDVQSTWGAATGEYPTFRVAGSTQFS
ncbi:MAG TPA: acylphosphatase, partial [Ktedonobacterales bacterium]|nr:acylphosphatase [Ktedonobacterales bacterium]